MKEVPPSKPFVRSYPSQTRPRVFVMDVFNVSDDGGKSIETALQEGTVAADAFMVFAVYDMGAGPPSFAVSKTGAPTLIDNDQRFRAFAAFARDLLDDLPDTEVGRRRGAFLKTMLGLMRLDPGMTVFDYEPTSGSSSEDQAPLGSPAGEEPSSTG